MGKTESFEEAVGCTPPLIHRPDVKAVRGLFIVTDLAIGGAEAMLFRLLSRIDRGTFSPAVVSLKGPGPLSERIADLGVPLYVFGKSRFLPGLRAITDLKRVIRIFRPDFIQGWMLHGSVAAEISSVIGGSRIPVLWNIRHSVKEFAASNKADSYRRSTAMMARFLGRISSWPDRIVYNSRTSAKEHERSGYDASRTVVVPNGFDCDVFRPRPECRRALRTSLGLEDDVFLIGLVARLHPVKDHDNFLRAARRLVSLGCPAHFVLIGKGTASAGMAVQIERLGLNGRVHTLGEQSDMPQLTAGLDVATCCSRSEAFPNAIGEAMACGVPCVTTDVGDCRELVGETGRVVPSGSPLALSDAWQELLELDPEQRRAMGEAARRRILREFSLDQIVSRYERLYAEVVRHRRD